MQTNSGERVIEAIAEALARWQESHPLPANGRRVYISTPINTGPRFLNWWLKDGCRLQPGSPDYEASHAAAVRVPNLAIAQTVGKDIVAAGRGWVISPVDLPEPIGWEQSNFHDFWSEVIRLFIDEVVFVDGWEFSDGCCREFDAALAKRAPCFDQRGKPISATEGTKRIESARKQLKSAGINTMIHDNVLAHLKNRFAANGVMNDH